MTEKWVMCVYCKHYNWNGFYYTNFYGYPKKKDDRPYCSKHHRYITHRGKCDDWEDDIRTIKNRPQGYLNRIRLKE